MYTGQVDVITNKQTWRSITYDYVDVADGTTTDLSDPLFNVDIVVTIKRLPWCGSGDNLATASIANSKVQIPGPGFYWQFEVSDLSGLCVGTYGLGVKVTVNGFVQDMIDGTVAILEGN